MKSQLFKPDKSHLHLGKLTHKKSTLQHGAVSFNFIEKSGQSTFNEDALLPKKHLKINLARTPVYAVAPSDIIQRATNPWSKTAWKQPNPTEKKTWGEAFPTIGGQTNTPLGKEKSVVKAVPDHMKATGITYKSESQTQETEELVNVKKRLTQWNRISQDGGVFSLSEEDIDELVKFAKNIKTKSGKNFAFSVLKTSGENKYEGGFISG